MSAETQVDVAIVGAGIAGIATAYYLCVSRATRMQIGALIQP